MLNTWIPD